MKEVIELNETILYVSIGIFIFGGVALIVSGLWLILKKEPIAGEDQ